MASAAQSNSNLDDHVDDEIAACLNLDAPKSFFLFAGAGSGKTRSLVDALNHVKETYGERLSLGGRRIAVITYTNAACDEIIRRVESSPLFTVRSIHSFAWELISGFNADIRAWLKVELEKDIVELKEAERKGKAGTKASIDRLAQIESKGRRLANLDGIKTFRYNPTGDNREKESLNHTEVIQLCTSFLLNKKLMQLILVAQYPILLIDESQDTSKHLVDAFFAVEEAHKGKFSLGLLGDTMQRIYADGKEKIEVGIPDRWVKPAKKLNHRCPKRIVDLINRIRSGVDGQVQEARSDAIDGIVRFFVFPANMGDKPAAEEAARAHMAKIAGDADWNTRDKCKILTLEHHMAAQRMGFQKIFEPLYAVSDFTTGLLDGTLGAVGIFAQTILPLVKAQQRDDKFVVANILRRASPLLSAESLKAATDQRQQMALARRAVDNLMSLWTAGEPTCGDVLDNTAISGLFVVPDSLEPALAVRRAAAAGDATEGQQGDVLSDREKALVALLEAPFSQVEPYARYVSDEAEFDTHQGVKGLEFDRVMVLMDDGEMRGFMFGYEKLFGAKASSDTDRRNEKEGKETVFDRTRRLLYVTCSRAEKSLALVAYSADPQAVKAHLIKNNWFGEGEIVLNL